MMHKTTSALMTKVSRWMLVVLMLISVFIISGRSGRSPITISKVTTSKLAGQHTRAIRSNVVFYRSFIQKIRTVNFQRIFLSCSNSLLLFLKDRLIQIQINTNLIVLLHILPIGCFLVRRVINYTPEQAEPFLYSA